jgi:hypothetical protein
MLSEYVYLVIKMYNDVITSPIAIIHYQFLLDVEIMMGLTFALPILEATHSLNKLLQNKDCFICD